MQLLLGSIAKNMIEAEIAERLAATHARGERVRIALFRVGARADDCRYERTILKASARLGIDAEQNVFDEDVENTRNAGMNAHLAKPIEPERLYETISRFIAEAEEQAGE